MCFFFLKEAKNQQEQYVVHFFLTFLVFLEWLKMCTPDCYQTFYMILMLDAHGAFLVFFYILRPDEALGGGNQGPSAPGWARQHHSQRDGGVRPVAPPTWLVSNFLVRPASS